MKIGKEIKINNHADYNLSFGSMNKNNPDSVYINIASWIEPQTDFNSITVRNLRKSIKQSVFNLLNHLGIISCFFFAPKILHLWVVRYLM